MFQDELHKTVVAGVMKLSSVEENACSDFDFEKEVKNSIGAESPKPKPRYSFLKRESYRGRNNELEKQDDDLPNTCCSTSDPRLSSTANVYKLDSSTFGPECDWSLSWTRRLQQFQEGVGDNSARAKARRTKLKKDTKFDQSKSHAELERFGKFDAAEARQGKGNAKEKAQTGMKLIGIKSQNPETSGKSSCRRSLNSSVESLECSLIEKSPQSKTTEPRYLGTLKILDKKSNETSNVEATDTIRASIYQEWLERKRQVLSENKRHQKLKVQQENMKRDQKSIANKEEAKASFEAWKTRKKNVFQETCQKKKEEEKIKQQAEAEKEVRKEEAKKVFEKWKEGKDRYLQENLQKQKQIRKEKREKEKEQVKERKEGSASAFVKWNEEKEMVMKQRMIEIKKVQQKKKSEEEYSRCVREEMAALVYKEWLAEKEKNEKKQKRMKSALCRDPLPPWSPPNKTVPFGK